MAKPQLTEEQVLALLRAKVDEFGSQQELARRMGISQSYLSDVLHRRRDISDSILQWLKLQSVTTYVPKH